MYMIISIKNNKFNIKSVFTKKDTANGMMGKKFSPNFDGMLFLMEDGLHCFWMKNCIVSLDIIFIKHNKIVRIYHDCPPCKGEDCENYCGEADTILEIKGGSCSKLGIREGDLVSF